MKRFATWFAAVVVLGTGTLLLFAQSPRQPERTAPTATSREKLRANVIKLKTEVEMLRLDYEISRELLLNQIKINAGMKMLPAVFGAFNGTAAAPAAGNEQEKKANEAEAREQKKNDAEEAAAFAASKKELSRTFASLTAKQLDLEDAERAYRAATH